MMRTFNEYSLDQSHPPEMNASSIIQACLSNIDTFNMEHDPIITSAGPYPAELPLLALTFPPRAARPLFRHVQ